MEPATQSAPDHANRKRSGRRARIGAVEGWLSLVLIVVPYLLPSVDHPSPEDVLIGVGLFGASCLLALDGWRYASGWGKAAAEISLALNSLFFVLVVLASLMRGLG